MSAAELGLDLRSPQEKASANTAAYYAQPGRVEGPGGPAATMLAGMESRPATPVPPEWQKEMDLRNMGRRGEALKALGITNFSGSSDTARRLTQEGKLKKQSTWLNAPNAPAGSDTAALLASRSPTTGRTREQVKTERQKEEAKRATRSEYRKTGVRVTPEMLTARTTLDSLGAPQTLEDALGQIALSARGYGGGGAVAPALAQLMPSLAMGNQANMKEQNEDARMGLAASIQAAGILDPLQRKGAFDRITAFEGRGKGGRSSTAATALTPSAIPGTLTPDELEEALQIVKTSTDLAVGDKTIKAKDLAKIRLEARFPGKSQQIFNILVPTPKPNALGAVIEGARRAQPTVSRVMGGMPR
jgi:hypothetical protein